MIEYLGFSMVSSFRIIFLRFSIDATRISLLKFFLLDCFTYFVLSPNSLYISAHLNPIFFINTIDVLRSLSYSISLDLIRKLKPYRLKRIFSPTFLILESSFGVSIYYWKFPKTSGALEISEASKINTSFQKRREFQIVVGIFQKCWE